MADAGVTSSNYFGSLAFVALVVASILAQGAMYHQAANGPSHCHGARWSSRPGLDQHVCVGAIRTLHHDKGMILTYTDQLSYLHTPDQLSYLYIHRSAIISLHTQISYHIFTYTDQLSYLYIHRSAIIS